MAATGDFRQPGVVLPVNGVIKNVCPVAVSDGIHEQIQRAMKSLLDLVIRHVVLTLFHPSADARSVDGRIVRGEKIQIRPVTQLLRVLQHGHLARVWHHRSEGERNPFLQQLSSDEIHSHRSRIRVHLRFGKTQAPIGKAETPRTFDARLGDQKIRFGKKRFDLVGLRIYADTAHFTALLLHCINNDWNLDRIPRCVWDYRIRRNC